MCVCVIRSAAVTSDPARIKSLFFSRVGRQDSEAHSQPLVFLSALRRRKKNKRESVAVSRSLHGAVSKMDEAARPSRVQVPFVFIYI